MRRGRLCADLGAKRKVARRLGPAHSDEARLALRASEVLVDHRHAHVGPLAALAWTLRNNVTFYDALYVALAMSLDVPLLTADVRLSRAPQLPCAIEVL